ncbi:AtpZ/AtpI family protein [Acidicapsa acidisoli]|uniref:AtpZ/AtpI family protein n=1 Tax=Acidicapsa acidisoli TaxID=1615681 RepID=UPI0021E02D5A|nr:AtpZ/AtpI family protein [Acidicapsa acidisoli]
MPFHRPIPEDKLPARSGDSRAPGMRSLVQAEKVMQIAFVLPCAMLLGWGLGWCVDHFLHVGWATFVGLVLGLIAGMVSVIRTAVTAMNSISDRGSK